MKLRFWPIFKKNKKQPPSPYSELIRFLISEVSSPAKATSLIQEANDFTRQSPERQHKDVVRIYLSFEQYCCTLDDILKPSREAFRKQTINKFPHLRDNEFARLPFLEPGQARLLLTVHFYKLILNPLSQIIGLRKGSSQQILLDWCNHVWKEKFDTPLALPDFNWKEGLPHKVQIKKLSQTIFKSLSLQFSILNLERLYHKAYENCIYLYRDFETSPFIIHLLPAQFLKPDYLRILGKTQMEQILLENISQLEKLNRQLRAEADQNKNLSHNLQEQSHAFEKLLSNPLDCIIVVNEGNRINFWNHAAEELFRYDSDEVIGQNLQNIILPVSFENQMLHNLPHYARSMRDRVLDKTFEIEVWDRDKNIFPVEINIRDYRKEGNIQFIIFIRNISERKAYEASLIESRKTAEDNSLYKSRFFANMSHEIRTPLNAIIGFTDLMLQQEATSEQKKYLSMIQTSGNNLMSLLNDILELSKIEEGELQINPATEVFTEKITESIAPYQSIAESKGLKFSLYFEEAFPRFIKLDYYRYNQVLVNLLGNALKFTDNGEIRVRFNYQFNENGDFRINGTISDSGRGIHKEKLATIFQSFKQENADIKEKFGGTGLGLSISMEIAKALGGHIKVISPSVVFKNKGSDFTFSIQAEIADTYHHSETVNTPKIETGKLSILLVEDNPINQVLLLKVLENNGFRVQIAEDGIKALEILKNQSFDLIFMDINMPDMDGYVTTRAIRSQLKLKTPIIAISANVYPEDIEKSLQSGMQAHLGKPFKSENLLEVIRQVTEASNLNPTDD
ncbi:MAG: response regulator [Owenweeksia sp.]